MPNKQKIRLIALMHFALGGLLTAAIGWSVLAHLRTNVPGFCDYSLINVGRCNDRIRTDYADLKTRLVAYIEQRKAAGAENLTALYFRDLRTGMDIGVNEGTEFPAASLYKVPILMAYYKMAESDPTLLEQTLVAPEQFSSPPQDILPPTQSVESGKTYTIDDLINRMIIYSDNRAREMLLAKFSGWPDDQNPILKTLTAVGIATSPNDGDFTATPIDYSRLLRLLYDASYLNAKMSNRALRLLIKSEFRDGLIKPLPADIRVANKFGVQRDYGQGLQLQDCGIVYFPHNPYTVCVVVRGKDLQSDEETIQTISKMIYDEVAQPIQDDD